jgi:hypothetical protein
MGSSLGVPLAPVLGGLGGSLLGQADATTPCSRRCQAPNFTQLSGTSGGTSCIMQETTLCVKCRAATPYIASCQEWCSMCCWSNLVVLSAWCPQLLLRFVSDDIWGSRGRCRVISRSIAEYLVQAWDVRNSCKHNGAVLPLPSAPEGRGADGVDAMA